MTRNLIKAYPLGWQEGRTRVRDFTTLYVMYVYIHRKASAVCEFSRRTANGYIGPLGRKNVVRLDDGGHPKTWSKNGTACGLPGVLGGAVSFHAAPNKKSILVYIEKTSLLFNPAAAV